MEDFSKKWWTSKGVWASIVGIVTTIGHIIQNGHVGSEDIISLASFGGALYGRITADKPIAGTAAAKVVNDKIADALMTPAPAADPRGQEHL